ncbi:hypothetical protein BGC30_02680 [Novacetimonas hansenii]|nr:hypothetical protein BGC30_02680 [Novacetimonas hansenii]
MQGAATLGPAGKVSFGHHDFGEHKKRMPWCPMTCARWSAADMRKVVCCAPGGWACPLPPRTGMVRWGIEVTGGRRMVRCLRSQGQGD